MNDDNQTPNYLEIVKAVERLANETVTLKNIVQGLISSLEVAAEQIKSYGGDTAEFDALVDTAKKRAFAPGDIWMRAIEDYRGR